MTTIYDRAYFAAYVKQENDVNKYGVEEESQQEVVDIIEFLGPEACRPITRLLLQSWREINDRVSRYSESDWAHAETIFTLSKEQIPRRSIALVIEALEGEDTSRQNDLHGPLPELGKHVHTGPIMKR